MAYLFAVLGVWAVWNALATYVEGPGWFWTVLPLVLGIGGQALIDASTWWWGLGIGGAAILVMRLNDLLLVTADWIRVTLLQRGPRTRR